MTDSWAVERASIGGCETRISAPWITGNKSACHAAGGGSGYVHWMIFSACDSPIVPLFLSPLFLFFPQFHLPFYFSRSIFTTPLTNTFFPCATSGRLLPLVCLILLEELNRCRTISTSYHWRTPGHDLQIFGSTKMQQSISSEKRIISCTIQKKSLENLARNL